MDDRCLACHEAIGADVAAGEGLHGRLAAGPDPPRCRACHPEHGGASAALTLVDEATFPHELTGFALHGSHAGVACDACHPRDGYQMDEARPRDCVTCHEDDDEHRGALGRRCEQCHSTGGWADVTFDHAGFPLDHGSEERTAGCDTCHPSGLRRYSCLGCHEHTRANLADEHDGRSVEELAACVSCHPGGRKADD
jgi:hypothetical protein